MGKWISGLVSDANGDPSTKRVLFGIVVLFALGWLTTTLAMAHWVITSEWNTAFLSLIGATASAYGATAIFAEKKNLPTDKE